MAENPLLELQRYGQSFWYDNISRSILRSGELKRMIEEEGLRGVTSNPTIFYKAIKSGTEYDQQLKELFSRDDNLTAKEIFYALASQDITEACDLLMDVYKKTEGDDGYVSLEVDPHLAHDTEGTIREAKELFHRINRPNLMIKVPATLEGLPAVEELIYEGVNVNVTLLFSVDRYREVMDAYLRGLERRMNEDKPLDSVASVASFFVSRVDTLTDRYLEEMLADADDEKASKIRSLFGKTAVANAQIAYDVFKQTFSTDRFLRLKLKGARIQRLLFGSTSTKNPTYSDILYVQELIGPGTVNTMPDDTWRAFKDHGRAERTIDRDVQSAYSTIEELQTLGISLDEITKRLEDEGVRLFAESFDALIGLIESKRQGA